MQKRKNRIAIIGGAQTVQHPKEAVELAQKLGKALAKRHFDVITGAGPGLPFEVAAAAKDNGARVYGVSGDKEPPTYQVSSPSTAYVYMFDGDCDEGYAEYCMMGGVEAPDTNTRKEEDVFDHITYTGFGDTGRCVPLVAGSHAAMVVGGGKGTFAEFAIAVKETKLIGVLEGTGGLADQIRKLEEHNLKEIIRGTKIIYSDNPKTLVKMLDAELNEDKTTSTKTVTAVAAPVTLKTEEKPVEAVPKVETTAIVLAPVQQQEAKVEKKEEKQPKQETEASSNVAVQGSLDALV